MIREQPREVRAIKAITAITASRPSSSLAAVSANSTLDGTLLTRVCRGMSCSCAAMYQRPWILNIECPIEYPCDPLPRQGVHFQVGNWHSLTLTANLEFNEKGWSIGDSNPGHPCLPGTGGGRFCEFSG